VSAISFPEPTLAAEPTEQAQPRRARRWYRQPALASGVILLAIILFAAIAAPLLTSYDPLKENLGASLLGPSSHHWLGTDQTGRDTFSRLLYGLRTDLRIAFIAVLFPFCIGTIIGSIAGYFGGWVDTVLMRLVDVVVAFPFYVLLIALVFVLGPGESSIYIGSRWLAGSPMPASSGARSSWPNARTTWSPPGRAACPRSGSSAGTCCRT